jgi:carboxyl-terminal processing protease
MKRSLLLTWAVALAVAAYVGLGPCARAGEIPEGLADRVLAVIDAVMDYHFEPPTRQEMILGAIYAVNVKAGAPQPARLAHRVSALTTPEQFASLLAETWPQSPSKSDTAQDLEAALFDGLLRSVPGGASLISAKELKVQQQLAGNLYVGIHIALSYDDKLKRATIGEVFEGGPAYRAGLRKGDIFEEIDGVSTEGMTLRDVVDRLRGEEGTDVVIQFHKADSKEPQTVKVTRGRLPQATVTGVRQRPGGGWDVLLEGEGPVGYLSFKQISGSTPQELRVLARQLEDEGARALVLDLRKTGSAQLHPTVLLADSLLDSGTIGRVRMVDRVMTYEAEPDALFRGWPLAVLVDQGTAAEAEWLAFALKDNHRAEMMLGGSPIMGRGTLQTAVPLADGAWAVMLPTSRLERGDGRPLTQPFMFADRPGVRAPLPRRAEEAKPDLVLPAALKLLRERLKAS